MQNINIIKALPTADVILQLEPEELAGYILGHLVPQNGQVHPDYFFQETEKHYRDERVTKVLMEAWSWLVHEGLLVQKDRDGWFFISRRGQKVQGRQDLQAYRRSNILPKQSLHPIIAERVWPNFIRGEYDTSVFQAFKEVEVAVRIAGSFAKTDIGTDLMGKAFNINSGPLTDATLPEAERRAMLNLFVGAVGLFKNPSSHRHVTLTDPHEAAEIISFASLLMRIVDTRTAGKS